VCPSKERRRFTPGAGSAVVRRAVATAAVAVLLVLAGCAGGSPTAAPTGSGGAAPPDEYTLTERWTAGNSSVAGNHHAIAAGRVGDEAVVAIPIGGRSDATGCKLLVVDGAGEERWTAEIPPAACTIHAVADPTVADFVGDDHPEVIASSTESEAVAYDALTGNVTFRYPLSNYGYTRPVVADATGDGRAELVVTDIDGTVAVVRPDGSTVWRRPLDAYSWSAPAVADFDTDGRPETVVGIGNGTVLAFNRRGQFAWTTDVGGAVTWSGDGDVDGDEAREFVAATESGLVASVDGRNGTVEWTRLVGELAAVDDPADGDGDAVVEVYATNATGTLFALDGRDGSLEWSRSLTDASTRMTPPPVVGDITGDGTSELVTVTNDGFVRVLDPADGRVLASYARDASVYTHATLADTDGDGAKEVYVMYGDGTAVALTLQISNSSSS